MRIKYEMIHSLCSYTVTLTYDQDHIPNPVPFYDKDPMDLITGDNTQVSYMMDNPWFDDNILFWYHPYDIDHVQRFFKRLRKDGFKFRYFGVAEYGGKRGRPHYHIIFFFEEYVSLVRFTTEVVRQWPYGCEISIDDTDDRCIGYTLKYCLKFFNVRQPEPKIFLSKKPFIGAGYLQDETVKRLQYYHDDVTTCVTGRMRLPRLLRDKIYSDDDKELCSIRLQSQLEKINEDTERKASALGITVQEYKKRLQDSFKQKCINSMKRKKL